MGICTCSMYSFNEFFWKVNNRNKQSVYWRQKANELSWRTGATSGVEHAQEAYKADGVNRTDLWSKPHHGNQVHMMDKRKVLSDRVSSCMQKGNRDQRNQDNREGNYKKN